MRACSRAMSTSGLLIISRLMTSLPSLDGPAGVDPPVAGAAGRSWTADAECVVLGSRPPLGRCGNASRGESAALRLERAPLVAGEASSPLSAPLTCVLPLLLCRSMRSCCPSVVTRGEPAGSFARPAARFADRSAAAAAWAPDRFEDVLGETTGGTPR